jgi:transposase
MRRRLAGRGTARQAWLGAAGKVIVFGVVKRNGHVKALPIAAHSRLELMRQIQAHTRGDVGQP